MITQRNEQVEIELSKLVDILKRVVPKLTEVRVFGSYNNGNWNPKTSDVDIFVETADESLSYYKHRPKLALAFYDNESKERQRLIRIIEIYYRPTTKFDIQLSSKEDFDKINETFDAKRGELSLGQSIKSGRLLYSNQE